MSAPDRTSSETEIAALVQRYTDAINSGDAEAWGETWADDAAWVLGENRTAEGRDAIVALWRSAMSRFETVHHAEGGGSTDVDLQAGAGFGSWNVTESLVTTDGSAEDMTARYNDIYVLVDGAWFFQRRELVRS